MKHYFSHEKDKKSLVKLPMKSLGPIHENVHTSSLAVKLSPVPTQCFRLCYYSSRTFYSAFRADVRHFFDSISVNNKVTTP